MKTPLQKGLEMIEAMRPGKAIGDTINPQHLEEWGKVVANLLLMLFYEY